MATQTYSLAINYVDSNQFATNVLHYDFDDAGFNTRAEAALDLASSFDATNRTALKAMIPASSRVLSYKARCVSAVGGFEAVFFPTGAVAGTRAGNSPTSGLSLVIEKKAVGNFFRRVGKVFLPGVSVSDCVDGIFTAGLLAAVSANMHIFTDTFNLAGGGAPLATPVIFHRGPPQATHSILRLDLLKYAGTQRRRQIPV